MREHGDLACCARCAGTGVAARTRRRSVFKAAVFPAPHTLRRGTSGPGGAAAATDPGSLPRVITGLVLDVSPQMLVVACGAGEQRFVLSTRTAAWRGTQVEPAALMAGDQVLVRILPSRQDVADKIWVGIGRVTGTILERSRQGLLVDEGRTKSRQAVVISPSAASRIQVRFPRLEPGHLIDVIGVRRGGALEAMVPATSQPPYRADQAPTIAYVTGAEPGTISGSATWHETGAGEEPEGVAYPAIDPEGGCAEYPAAGPACAELPYLAVGSKLSIRNECTGHAQVLLVTGCGAVARLFCDRCLTCGTSPRGRIADLTPASFAVLGGELEQGCFNATIAMGQ